jgi:predicted DNA binding CopG/RHH family protein
MRSFKMKDEYDLKSMKQRPKREADPEALKMSVHLRLDAIIVSDLKEKAEKMGLPYQTLINSVLKQYLNGEFVSRETISMVKEILSHKDEVA